MPRDSFLAFSPSTIGEEEIEAVSRVLRSGWVTTGPEVRAFEAEFAERVGAEAALATSSWTTGAELMLRALGIGAGDEVITTPMTFCATANIIEHVGATTVLADVEDATLNIDPSAVERAITERTKAILPVHYAGHPAEMDRLSALAEQRGIAIVEDAAHSLPAAFRGRPIGAAGTMAAFSFYATKNLSTAEGGMVVGPRNIVDRCRVIGLHGMSRDAWKRYDAGGSWRYDVVDAGFKTNMTDVQAAMGRVQLRRLDAFERRRREIVQRYDESLAGLPGLTCPIERDHVRHAWHLYVLRVDSELAGLCRDDLVDELRERNIGTSVHFIPLHQHSYYRERYGWSAERVPVADRASREIVSLPLSPALTDRDVEDVIEALHDILDR